MNKNANNKYNIKAFTLMELIIVMLISSIGISLLYNIYSQSSIMFNKKIDANRTYTDILHLHKCLKKEIANSKSILISKTRIHAMMENNTIEYDFDNYEFIIRKHSSTDTFFIKHGKIRTISNQLAKSSINIEIPISFNSDSITLFYSKGISIQNRLSNNEIN